MELELEPYLAVNYNEGLKVLLCLKIVMWLKSVNNCHWIEWRPQQHLMCIYRLWKAMWICLHFAQIMCIPISVVIVLFFPYTTIYIYFYLFTFFSLALSLMVILFWIITKSDSGRGSSNCYSLHVFCTLEKANKSSPYILSRPSTGQFLVWPIIARKVCKPINLEVP